MDLASDTCGLIRQTPISYMHIWLVEFKAILRKANFILSLQNISSTSKNWDMAWKPLSLLLLFRLQILLEKLECWDSPFTSLFSCSELSVTGDTAMIIDLHSREVVHVHHLTQSTHSVLDPHVVKRKGEDWDETFGKQSPVPLGRPIQDIHPLRTTGIRFLELT